MLWSKTLEPLEGGVEISHNILVLIFFLLVAFILGSIIWPKTEAKTAKTSLTSSPKDRMKKFDILENDRLRKWSNRFVLVWILIIGILIYAFLGLTLIKDLVIPSIQKIANTPFGWDTEYFIDILMPLIFSTIWIVMPFMFYSEIYNKRQSEKRESHGRGNRQ
jgi:hypothetical protein